MADDRNLSGDTLWIMTGLTARIFALCVPALLLAGCGSSVWEAEYSPNDLRPVSAIAPLPAGVPIRIKEVPWEPVDALLTSVNADVLASGTPLASWSADRQDALKARLLNALQISGDPSKYQILGRSQFRTTDSVNPIDGSLATFARHLGTNQVVWARTYEGKADRVASAPTTEAGKAYYDTNDPSGGRRSGTATGPVTVWQPLVVKADEFSYVAFFIAER